MIQKALASRLRFASDRFKNKLCHLRSTLVSRMDAVSLHQTPIRTEERMQIDDFALVLFRHLIYYRTDLSGDYGVVDRP